MSVVLMFLLIVLDGVVPLVPGEASLLAHAPGAMAAGWPAVAGLGALAAVAVIFMAGATRMPWQRYLLANALGVTLWASYLMVVVTVISQASRWLRRRLAASRGPKRGTRPAHAGGIQYTISPWPTLLTSVN